MSSQLGYRWAADLVVAAHFAYVAFVIVGLVAVVVGWWRNWQWTRNLAFRLLHLTSITIVVGEALCGIACPLTTWEQSLRSRAGETSYEGAFVGNLLHELLFYEAEPWVFTTGYCVFGLIVLATFFLHPPRLPRRRSVTESHPD